MQKVSRCGVISIWLASLLVGGCATIKYKPLSVISTDQPVVLREGQLAGWHLKVQCRKPQLRTEPNPELCMQIADLLTSQGADARIVAAGELDDRDAKADRPYTLVVTEKSVRQGPSNLDWLFYWSTLTFYPVEDRHLFALEIVLLDPAGHVLDRQVVRALISRWLGVGYALGSYASNQLDATSQEDEVPALVQASRDLYGQITSLLLGVQPPRIARGGGS